MQRELRFRAWDTETNKFLWTGFESFISESHEDKPQEIRKGNLALNSSYAGLGNRVIFSQYTGLVDRLGNKIYEGDIVKQEKRVVDFDLPSEEEIAYKEQISFIEYTAKGFWVHDEDFGWEGEGLWNWDDIEVIGNIYENPELLNNSKQGESR